MAKAAFVPPLISFSRSRQSLLSTSIAVPRSGSVRRQVSRHKARGATFQTSSSQRPNSARKTNVTPGSVLSEASTVLDSPERPPSTDGLNLDDEPNKRQHELASLSFCRRIAQRGMVDVQGMVDVHGTGEAVAEPMQVDSQVDSSQARVRKMWRCCVECDELFTSNRLAKEGVEETGRLSDEHPCASVAPGTCDECLQHAALETLLESNDAARCPPINCPEQMEMPMNATLLAPRAHSVSAEVV